MMPARITQASRETFCAIPVSGGAVVTLTTQPFANRRSDSGGSAMVSFWPSATERSRIRLAEKSARIATPGAASGSSRARQNEPRKSSSETCVANWFGVDDVDVAHAHFLGPQPDAHRSAVLEAVDALAGKLDRAEPQPLGAGHLGVEERHGADEVGDERGGRIAVDLRRRTRPARSRRGSSPRCGPPWRAPLPGRASP